MNLSVSIFGLLFYKDHGAQHSLIKWENYLLDLHELIKVLSSWAYQINLMP